ncbi:MAG: prephenate dehydratase [Thermoleophilaceae bacterium]|jgi:prephenate dehydratase|nr:prephenate dehydratase [Thermoleophilaceae bacterium]
MRVAYLGPAGTHSEEALRTSAPPEIEAVPVPTIYDAVMAVQEGTAERAVVPIENALEGSVAATLDTLAVEAADVRIAAEVVHPIHHCVVARSELSLSTVERVVSHPQATAQCARFLREHLPHAEIVSAPSTADAVLTVCGSDDKSVAIGSSLAAKLYGCAIVASNVEDHPDNVTRFVWLARAGEVGEVGADPKTSLVFWGGGDQSPGWLVAVLSEFAGRGVNLTRIESRPRRTGLGHYFFFVDLEGATGAAPVDEALEAVAGHVGELRVLGSYGRPPWLN